MTKKKDSKPGRGIPHKADEYKKEMVRRMANINATKKEAMKAVGLVNPNSFEKHYGEIWRIGKNRLNDMTFQVMEKMFENCVKHNKVHAQAIWMKTAGKWYEAKDPGEATAEAYKAFNAINFNALAPGEKAPEQPLHPSEDDSEEDYTH